LDSSVICESETKDEIPRALLLGLTGVPGSPAATLPEVLVIVRSVTKRRAIAGLAAGCLLAGGATALAEVTVYDNDFTTQGRYDEIARSGGGKRCDRKYREKSKILLASVKKAPANCAFRPPIQGDDELPNHSVLIDAKILKKTPKSARKGAFFEVTVRAGGKGSGYSLRIFPERQRFELSRGPDGQGFPASGKNKAIKKTNSRNKIRLTATGAEIVASVNNKELASVSDSNPGAVEGRKVRFSIGNKSDTKKKTVGTFKEVAVSVPDP
jgi:hypothetical protein